MDYVVIMFLLTHCISKAREEKVEFSGPVSSFGILVTGLNFILRRLFRTNFVRRLKKSQIS